MKQKNIKDMSADEIRHLIDWAMNEMTEYQKLINYLMKELMKELKNKIK